MIETEDFFDHWCGFYFFLRSPFFILTRRRRFPAFVVISLTLLPLKCPGEEGGGTLSISRFFSPVRFPSGEYILELLGNCGHRSLYGNIFMTWLRCRR